jgi:hypothetical protein
MIMIEATQNTSSTAPDQEANTRGVHVILLTLRIDGYTGIYGGRQIYKSSYRPLFDAAIYLLTRGLARPNDLIRLRFNNSDAYPPMPIGVAVTWRRH